MDKALIITGLQKAAVVLNALAFSLKDEKSHRDTLSLVHTICEAIKLLEKDQ